MGKVQRVLVYGNSVALAGIEASLGLDPECEVIGHAWSVDQQELCALQPDVVIFELDAVRPEFPDALSEKMPGLLLIGIDPESHAVLLTGQAARSITLDQITKIMRNRDPTSAKESILPSPGNQPVDNRKTLATEFLEGESNEHKNES